MLTISELPKPTKTNSVEAKTIEVGNVFLGKDGTWGRITAVCKPEKVKLRNFGGNFIWTVDVAIDMVGFGKEFRTFETREQVMIAAQ